MRESEQFVVPALGVVVLLSVFILGTSFYPLAYLIILGLLGLAAIGTYFLPPAVQIEMRIAIAALGVIVLVFTFNSLGFWLALMGFLGIGALQIRHRGVLQTPLHTVTWLQSLQSGGGGVGGSAQTPESAEAGTGTEAGSSAGTASVQAAALRGGNIGSIGGIGAAVMGIIVLLATMMPWLTINTINIFGRGRQSFTGWQLSELIARGESDSSGPYTVAGIIAILAVLGVVSVALPRVVSVIVGILGVVAMSFIYLYLHSESGDSRYGQTFTLGFGFWLATLAFVLMAALQAIPRPKN